MNFLVASCWSCKVNVSKPEVYVSNTFLKAKSSSHLCSNIRFQCKLFSLEVGAKGCADTLNYVEAFDWRHGSQNLCTGKLNCRLMLNLCSNDKREREKIAINLGYLKGVLNDFQKKKKKSVLISHLHYFCNLELKYSSFVKFYLIVFVVVVR